MGTIKDSQQYDSENELRIYQLADYIRKHGLKCYVSESKLYMEVESQLPSGSFFTDTVQVKSIDDVNKHLFKL
jgi:hypothetical protein